MFLLNGFKKRRGIIVKEKDLVTTLKILGAISKNTKFGVCWDIETGIFRDGDGGTEWYLDFFASDRKWNNFLNKVYAEKHTVMLGEDNEFYLM